MTTINHTLRFFSLFFGLFLLLAFAACNKNDDTNPKDEQNSDGSFVELTYKGKKYSMTAFGVTGTMDTIFTNPLTTDTFHYKVFTVVVSDLKPIQSVEELRVFGVSFTNYTGEGTYQYDSKNSDWLFNNTFSGVFGVLYYNIPDGEVFFFEDGQVKVDKDNDKEISGTLTLNVSGGPDGSNPQAVPCTGKFKIVKK